MTAVLRLDVHADHGVADKVEATRQFYCDVLGGREIASPTDGLWFLVRGVLVETGNQRPDSLRPITLRVKDPEALVARCWNAGYTVLVDREDDSSPTTFGLLDPFGVRIDLDRSVVTSSGDVREVAPAP